MGSIIDGKSFAAGLRARVADHVLALKARHGIVPGLAVVLVGDDPASEVYVRNKGIQTRAAGMASFEHKLPATIPQDELMTVIARLNASPAVHGILVQLPLPGHLDSEAVINAIEPTKDVDGFHVLSVGRLGSGQEAMVPCTPLGCLMMLRDRLGDLSGLHAACCRANNLPEPEGMGA